MKRHAPIGAEILSSIEFPYPVVPIVRHHHENWDGTGYPDKLKGEEIPLGARILSVVDCFDALTSDRPYRRRMTDAAGAGDPARSARRRCTTRRSSTRSSRDYQRIMPESERRAASGDARDRRRARARSRGAARSTPPPPADDGHRRRLLAVTSLSRALTGDARVADVGALLWTILRQVLPCETMAIFLPDVDTDEIAVRYAAGAHAPCAARPQPRERRRDRRLGRGERAARGERRSRRSISGYRAAEMTPALRSCLAVPLVEGETLVAVLALYRTQRAAFSEDEVRLVELLAPRLATSLATRPSRKRTSSSPPGPGADADQESWQLAGRASAGQSPVPASYAVTSQSVSRVTSQLPVISYQLFQGCCTAKLLDNWELATGNWQL